jgi:sugar lactone lactonase YvrE
VVAGSTGTFYGQAMTAGDIYTVAGDGTQGYSGDGGPATSAELGTPQGVAVDRAGNLLIADTHNNRVRVVAESTGTLYGQAMTAGDIYTVVGDGRRGYHGDGGPATSAKLYSPDAAMVDSAGNLVIGDTGNERVRVVAESTGTFYGKAMTTGDIHTVAGNGTEGYSGDGGPARGAQLNEPGGVSVDQAGNLLIADTYNNRIRAVAASTGTFYGKAMVARHIYRVAGDGKFGFAGDGGHAATAKLGEPRDVAVDAAGNLLIADTHNNRIRMVAESNGTFYRQAMTAGDIYTVAGDGTPGYSGDGGPATQAGLAYPYGVAVDPAGNLLMADSYDDRIRLVAASTGTFYGQAMTAGDIYTIAGTGVGGFNGDGRPATKARVTGPDGVAVDAAGNLLIADTGANRVRVVAESTGTLYGRAMTKGDIYTVAGDGMDGYSGDGGQATRAELYMPEAMASDPAGNLVISDSLNYRVRVVAEHTGTFYGQAMTAGDIYTIAGTSKGGFTGDGGQATKAELWFPRGVAVDPAGDVLIADSFNNRVRMVTP